MSERKDSFKNIHVGDNVATACFYITCWARPRPNQAGREYAQDNPSVYFLGLKNGVAAATPPLVAVASAAVAHVGC